MTGRPTHAARGRARAVTRARTRAVTRAVVAGAVLAGAVLVSGCDTSDAGAAAPSGAVGTPKAPAALAPLALDPATGRSDPVADPVYPRRGNPAVDVLLYDLDLSWDPDARQLVGQATPTIRAPERINKVPLDVIGELHA